MDKNHFFAIISQQAGHYQKSLIPEISAVFQREGRIVDFYSYEDNVRLREVLNQAQNAGYYSFLVAGGDGTTGLVASSIFQRPHRLGIIPVGTTNTIARLLDIPLTIKSSIEVAACSENVRSVDGLGVDDRLFILNVSLGLTSISLDNVNAEHKSKFGILAYILGIVRNSNRIKTHKYQVWVDGKTFNTRAIELHVTNTGIIGMPRFSIYRESRFDDGIAEILMLRRWSIKEIFNAILDILVVRKRQAIRLIARGEEILIRSNVPVAVQADGDIIQNTPVKINVRHQAINFIVPE
ncbi:MAG TPA: diacylglycerol kinase family protein [Chitinispirillaceae bacterium]|nr:diacylglycerol kinase family protein [Chitinispirillaceae bacterium]